MIKTEHLKSNKYNFKCKSIRNKNPLANELKSSINPNAYCD